MFGEATTSAFGRRAVTRAQIEAQLAVRQALARAEDRRAGRRQAGEAEPGAVHKWMVLRSLSEIRDGLGVSDRALSVLSALLSFHPETALSLEGDGLVVFPSNKALSLRANGMSEPTLRRHISALVEAGLIIRRDSPNGKRFARRDGGGRGGAQDEAPAVLQAYGFDLAPLVARAQEFEARLEAQRREQRSARLLKERINLLRRDLTKRIAFALDENLPGPWDGLRQSFLSLCKPLRKLRALADFADLAADLDALQIRVMDALQKAFPTPSADAAQSERHIPKSNPQQFYDSDPASDEAGACHAIENPSSAPSIEKPDSKDLPLAIILDACPDIYDYEFSGAKLSDWRSFIDAAQTVRPMLGISADAWREAVQTLGERGAATALAFILQRCEHSSEAARHLGPDGRTTVSVNGSPAIRSPGGYLRALTQKGREEPFNLWSAILGHLAQRAKAGNAGRSATPSVKTVALARP